MNTSIRPAIIAELTFRPTSEGGRETAIRYQTFGKRFGCLFLRKEKVFNCFILLSEENQIFPGDTAVYQVVFLHPELIISELQVGDTFQLKEINIIANGKILEILETDHATGKIA